MFKFLGAESAVFTLVMAPGLWEVRCRISASSARGGGGVCEVNEEEIQFFTTSQPAPVRRAESALDG